MSFQQNSFQQNAFQTGVEGGSATPEPFKPSPLLSAPRAPSSQGGYSTVPNLLVTTLALFAAASQDVKRDATLQNTKAPTAVQAFQPPNLLTETLGIQPTAPVGDQQTTSAPPPIRIGAAQQVSSRALLDFAVQPIPIGHQQTDSAPTINRVLYWDKGTNTLLFTLPLPVGKGQIESAPIQTADVSAEQTQSRAILDQAEQPIPIGEQRTNSQVTRPEVQTFTPEQIVPPVAQVAPVGHQQTDSSPTVTPAVSVFTPPQIIPPTVVQAELPPGRQSTDSSPPTPRIGEMVYARGVDPGPPAPESDPLPIGKQETDSAPPRPNPVDSFRSPTIIPPIVVAADIPIGHQSTDSAPYTIFRPLIDEPQNLLAGPLGLQPVASGQSEFMPTIRPSQVFLWLPPNVTIDLPAPVIEIPIGDQRTENQVTRPAVTVFTPPQIVPPVQNPIPIGHQQTDSAPIPAPGVQSFTAPVIIPPISGPLPIGQAHSDSAPIWAVPIGTSVGWTIPPDLLPPFVAPPVTEPEIVPAGKSKKRYRYIARFKGEDYEFSNLEDLEEFVAQAQKQEQAKPKKIRKPVKIRFTPEYQEEVSQVFEPPKISQLPASKALEQVRLIEKKVKEEYDDDEEAIWLILTS